MLEHAVTKNVLISGAGVRAVDFRGPAMTVLDRKPADRRTGRPIRLRQPTQETFDALAQAANQPAGFPGAMALIVQAY
jgi:hypothetical protein